MSCIEPGMAETEFSLVRFHGDAAKASKVYDGMKPLSGDDIAEAVFWAACRQKNPVGLFILLLFNFLPETSTYFLCISNRDFQIA